MLVLSRRPNETLVFPALETTIEVVGIKKGVVRLGITAPDHIRVLRGELPDRETEWAAKPKEEAAAPPLPRLNQLVEKRLAILRQGLDEVQRSMSAAQTEEAELLLHKLDEDLNLLRQRLHNEAESQPRTAVLRRPARCVCDGDNRDDNGHCQCPADMPRSR
jgi:carbon storage regulator CsrA